MKKYFKNSLFYILLALILIGAMSAVIFGGKSKAQTKYYEVMELFYNDQISEYELNLYTGDLIYTKRGDEQKYRYTVADVNIFYNDVNEVVQANNAKHRDENKADLIIKSNYKSGGAASVLAGYIPMIILGIGTVIFAVIIIRRMGSMMGPDRGAMNFGKAHVRRGNDKRKTTFADVAGADEEKAELEEIVEFLKSPQKFNELGARIPKGVLLVGPPGTGKTLLARAVAGEAGVPFFSISGSDFVEMYVGVGASRVRDLFEGAKKEAPAIVFIDEIDAVGRQRGAGLGGGHDEREQTLNQLLVEMDGFGANEGVIVIAATNRPDILDKALLRPGRFDRQVTVGYPDVKGREDILKVHSRGKPLGPDVNLKTIAKSTAGFTGADLENLLNEAALLSARKGLKAITEEQIEEATLKVIAGTEKKSRVMTEAEKRNTAYHEAGHAIIGYYLPTQNDIHQITIIPRGMALGLTISLPSEDKFCKYKNEMEEEISMLLGGRIAEALTSKDVSTGASNDIERATQIAKDMVVKYGMSEKLGPILYGNKNDEVFLGRDYGHINNCSQEVAAEIDSEVHRIINEAYARGEKILKEHIDKLYAVGDALVEKEKLDASEFCALMGAAPAEA